MAKLIIVDNLTEEELDAQVCIDLGVTSINRIEVEQTEVKTYSIFIISSKNILSAHMCHDLNLSKKERDAFNMDIPMKVVASGLSKNFAGTLLDKVQDNLRKYWDELR
jgi:hypothetical protein